MITLKNIKDVNVFDIYPQLTTIWPEPSNSLMKESVSDYFEFVNSIDNKDYDIGKMYYILENDVVIGMTGLIAIYGQEGLVHTHDYNFQNLEEIYLRWHGIIKDKRNKNIATQALVLLAKESQVYYPKAEKMIELIPNTENGNNSKMFFKKLGFKNCGDIEKYEWSTYDWQPMSMKVLDIVNVNTKINLIKLKLI